MAVQDGPTFKRYAANGVATVYAIPFKVLEAGDLVVTLDDVELVSGFVLTGLGNDTCTCTFSIAPSGDLLFRQVIPRERQTDYQENGDFLSGTVNNDFDRIWLALKELRRDSGRALSASPLEPEGIPELPVAALRAERMLAFDALGDPVPSNLTLEQLEEQPALALSAAETAVAAASAASDSVIASSASASASASFASASSASATLANKWAEEDEDVPVTTGPNKFSAKHWAAKAAAALSSLVSRVTALENIGKPFTAEYTSSEQSITSAGSLTLSHLMAAPPKLVSATLVCKTAALGYSVGDIVQAPMTAQDSGSGYGVSISWDATNINIKFGTLAAVFFLTRKDTGGTSIIAPADWRLVVRAWG